MASSSLARKRRIAWLSLFCSVLQRHPAKAIAAVWWWLLRRRVRAKARLREAAGDLPHIYRWWPILHPSAFENAWPSRLPAPPITVHIHLPAGHDPEAARTACRSVIRQSYTRWDLIVTASGPLEDVPIHEQLRIAPGPFPNRAAALRHVMANATNDYVVPLEPDARLTKGALHAYASTILDLPPAPSGSDLPVLYADQDELDAEGLAANPWFKPGWDRDMFIAQDYLSSACAIPRLIALESLASSVAPTPRPDEAVVPCLLAELLLGKPQARAVRINHVATTTPTGAWQNLPPTRAEVLRRLLPDIRIELAQFGTLICRHPIPASPPKVSIIVPTRDRVDLLQPCVESVLKKTDYPNFELIIVDNDSVEPETISYFEEIVHDGRVRLLHWPQPYNYSAVNNFAVAQACGEYICLLNNDTEVITPAWLSAMMSQAVRPGMGAVGAKLLYPDRSIQHAGVVVGIGGAAGHAHRGLPEGDPGYFAQALISREATAVTAACLVVGKDKFNAVGGLDEEGLAIAYNDIDLCLKLRASGLRNFYEPRAVLYHYESKSRGLDFAPEHLSRYMRELAVFQKRWNTTGFADPTHHRGLDPASEVYRLKV